MKRCWLFLFCCVLFVVCAFGVNAQAQSADAQRHVAAAKALAYEPGHDYTGSFETICVEPRPAAAPRGGGGGGGQRGDGGGQVGRRVPPREQWYTPPNKLFDNMYYVGSDNNSVYAITTSEGIILINAGEYYAVEAEVVEGLKKLGLDAANIKYVIIADAREPSYSGAKYLQDHYNSHVLASEGDWNVMAKTQVPPEGRPEKDMVVTDGQKFTLGDMTLTLYVTPGHTPGTISMIIPNLKDGSQRHTAALLGGRDPLANGEGVQYFPTELDAIKAWKTSVNRFQETASKANADVFLITRGSNDRLLDKIRALNYRKAGGPHPFVSKDGVKRYLTMTSECMDAQLAWRAGK
jgi:metallo-beta-lactamase class B